MPGVNKQHKPREFGRAFLASRHNDPRGGRASALERNVLRYRAIEGAAPAVSARGGRTACSSREVTPPPPWRNVRS